MPWVCMAGYLIDYEPALELTGKWRHLLMKHRISEVHMKQLIPMEGQYKALGWDIAKRDMVLEDFVNAINSTPMLGIGVAVEMAAWNKLKKHYPKIDFGNVQIFCAARILARVIAHFHDAKLDENLALVFDTDPDFGPSRFNLFCTLMGHDRRAARRLTSITFAHPDQYPGLQAADLLAWETRKELMQREGGYASTKRWRQMFDQMPSYHLDYVGEKWTQDEFDKQLSDLTGGLSGLMAKWRAQQG